MNRWWQVRVHVDLHKRIPEIKYEGVYCLFLFAINAAKNWQGLTWVIKLFFLLFFLVAQCTAHSHYLLLPLYGISQPKGFFFGGGVHFAGSSLAIHPCERGWERPQERWYTPAANRKITILLQEALNNWSELWNPDSLMYFSKMMPVLRVSVLQLIAGKWIDPKNG